MLIWFLMWPEAENTASLSSSDSNASMIYLKSTYVSPFYYTADLLS